MIEVHACTPYNPQYITENKDQMIDLMIDIKLFWEMLLTKLRGTIIAHAAKVKRLRSQKENTLNKEIEKLNHLFILDMNDKQLEQEIKIKNNELEELRDIKLKGAFIRSRSQMFSQEEKPNKLFLNLENNNFISKNIKELIKPNNVKITEPKDILEEMRLFYEDLYSYKRIINSDDTIFHTYRDNLPKLNDEENS